VPSLPHGVKDGSDHIAFYGTPEPGNATAAERHAQNRFSVTRQLRYSRDETQRALDAGFFISSARSGTFIAISAPREVMRQGPAGGVLDFRVDRRHREALTHCRLWSPFSFALVAYVRRKQPAWSKAVEKRRLAILLIQSSP